MTTQFLASQIKSQNNTILQTFNKVQIVLSSKLPPLRIRKDMNKVNLQTTSPYNRSKKFSIFHI